MLSEEQLNALPQRIVQRLEKINTEYLIRVGEQVKKLGELGGASQHRLLQLKALGVKDIEKELAAISEKNIAEIYEIFDIVAMDGYQFSKQFFAAGAFIPYAENIPLQQYIKSLAKQTADSYLNLSQTTMLSEAYQNIIDEAVLKTSLGLDSYQATMRQSLKALADKGIQIAEYPTGYTRRLDTAVRQNILWGVKECNQGMQDLVGQQFGADGYQISHHANPRPTHEKMGGRQYSFKEFYSQGIDRLLADYGCLHFKFSIVLGVSQPLYSDSQLLQMNEKDRQTISFEGKEYTGYEATQMQRKLETAIRHSKDRVAVAKAAEDKTMLIAEQSKLRSLTAKYSSFSDTAGLSVKAQRIRIK